MPEYLVKFQDSFKCAHCGRCCLEFTGIPLIEDDIKSLSKALDMPGYKIKHKYLTRFNRGFFLAQPCVFYDKGSGCKIYKLRPMNCRLFPAKAILCTDNIIHLGINLACNEADINLTNFENEINSYEPQIKDE